MNVTFAISTMVLGILSLMLGCTPASQRASFDKLPPIEIKVLGATRADQALARLAALSMKDKGKDNILFSLTFVEPPPKDLMPSWTMLDNAFAKLAGSGITYLPMDYFNTSRSPTPIDSSNQTIMTTGKSDYVYHRTDGSLAYRTLPLDDAIFAATKNADGTNARYLRLRMALSFDRDLKTSNRGAILRALAKVGSEYIEPSAEIGNESYTGRITVSLGYVEENGNIGPHNVIVTADTARLGATDNFGMIISSTGGAYYDKATVSHGLAAAVNEAVGHAVFVLICKTMNLDYQSILQSVDGFKSGHDGTSEAGNTTSARTHRIVQNEKLVFRTGDTITVKSVEGNSIVIEISRSDPNTPPVQKRLYVGDIERIEDKKLNEKLNLQLVAIRFKTTAEFRETVVAASDAR